MRIGGKKVIWLAMKICKVAPSTSGNQNFFSDAFGAFEHQHTAPSSASLAGTHQAGRPAAQNNDVEGSLAQKGRTVIFISAIGNYSATPLVYAPLLY
jgi:hypothetical protein